MASVTSVHQPRLHLGCGNEVLPGWVNHDLAKLAGVDVVHDLDSYPWPFDSETFFQVRLFHVLEHIAQPVRAIEELHRITAPGGVVHLRVPYWSSQDMMSDPTHKGFFNEYTFDFFDPTKRHCRERPYYSTARFDIRAKVFWIKPGRAYRPIRSPAVQRVLSGAARHLNGVIWVLEFELVKIGVR